MLISNYLKTLQTTFLPASVYILIPPVVSGDGFELEGDTTPVRGLTRVDSMNSISSTSSDNLMSNDSKSLRLNNPNNENKSMMKFTENNNDDYGKMFKRERERSDREVEKTMILEMDLEALEKELKMGSDRRTQPPLPGPHSLPLNNTNNKNNIKSYDSAQLDIVHDGTSSVLLDLLRATVLLRTAILPKVRAP